MKTILLGPNGQLGFDIQRENARRGEPLDIAPLPRAALDLADIDAAVDTLRGRDFHCLINCSGYHRTDEAERNADLAFSINAHLVARLAELCAQKKARFVHISTDYVFGGQIRRAPFEEGAPKAPINVYGASKAMGEDLALLTGGDVVIARVASLFGVAGASGKGGNFVETMIRVGRDKGAVRVVADQAMSPTATADVAAALIVIIESGLPSGVWHVVNSGAATWHAFASRIIERAGVAATVIPVAARDYPTTAKRPAYSVLDNSKVGSAIGAMRPWQDALDDYLAAKGYR